MDINEKCREIAEGFSDVAEIIEGLSVQDYLLIRQAAFEEVKADNGSAKKQVSKAAPGPVKQTKKASVRVFKEGDSSIPLLKQEPVEPNVTEEIEHDDPEIDEYELLRSIPDTWN